MLVHDRTSSDAFVLLNPCPVCGAETALAEIEPHPVHVNLEIHGYESPMRVGQISGRVSPAKANAFSLSNAAGCSLGQSKAVTSCRCLSVYWSRAASNCPHARAEKKCISQTLTQFRKEVTRISGSIIAPRATMRCDLLFGQPTWRPSSQQKGAHDFGGA